MPVKGDALNKGIERPECPGGSSFIAMSTHSRAFNNDRPIGKYFSAPASVRSTVRSTAVAMLLQAFLPGKAANSVIVGYCHYTALGLSNIKGHKSLTLR